MVINISDVNSFDYFNDIYEKIHNFFKNIKSGSNFDLDQLTELYSNNDSFLRELQMIKSSLDDIFNSLSSNLNLKNESVLFFSIKRMIVYLLNDIRLFLINVLFIDSLLYNFFNLIQMRLINEDYERYYNEFLDFIELQKEFFYSEIFGYCNNYEESIIEITNVLW